MNWRLFAASVIGKAHLDDGLPCQDAYSDARVGQILIAAVCDGAGSAPRSDLGAVTCADAIVKELHEVIEGQAIAEIDEEQIISSLISHIGDVVEKVRQLLTVTAAKHGIGVEDLACTLVGVVVRPTGGFFFHIGDGFGIAQLEGIAGSSESKQDTISIPENGEYANETWFVTSDAWREHLRLTQFSGSVNRLVLMTDGAMPFVLDKGQRQLFSPFIEPVINFFAGVSEQEGSEALHATLANERIDSITADDKTLLIAFIS